MKLTELIIKHLTHSFGLPVLKLIIKPNLLGCSKDDLASFSDQTFGKDIYLFLAKHEMNLLTHFETHDAKHVLLGYGVSDIEEAKMQFFFLGNGTYSIPVFSATTVCLFLLPKQIPQFIKAFKRGRKCPNIKHIKLEDFLYENTSNLKSKLLNNL
jgi:hypothetical protein